jgi:predicted dehydrogenase
MLARAADLVATRQKSGKKPRTFSDYREMLNQKDLDIVLIATPDHWHALPMIAAVQAGIDVWVQKPISVDIVEGQAMVAAARRHKRVVQVGLQRRSTPHIVEARDRFINEGKLGKIGLVEICCYYHMRATGNPPDTAPPPNLDYEMWTGPAPMRPYNAWYTPEDGARSWNTATASWATCAFTCSI